MKACGIICEYNPFHEGHRHHLQESKSITDADVLVCVMSGNFVQRGEPAIVDKWQRAKVAIEHGANLIVELPSFYALQSGNHFAKHAIDLLSLLQVQELVFGSESGDLDKLKALAEFELIDDEYKKEGLSQAKAYEKIYGRLSPNDTLGIAYLKAAKRKNIVCHAIPRKNDYASAHALRNAVYDGHPFDSIMKNLKDTHHIKKYYPTIRTALLTLSDAELSQIFLMDEGIEHHFIKMAALHNNYDDFLDDCISKRYTKSHIQRILMHVLLHNTKQDVDSFQLYKPRILAMDEFGCHYLKLLKQADISYASCFRQMDESYRKLALKESYVYHLHEDIDFQREEMQAPLYIQNKTLHRC